MKSAPTKFLFIEEFLSVIDVFINIKENKVSMHILDNLAITYY